jgi:hypothetical protein
MNYKINSGRGTSALQVNPSRRTERCAVLVHGRTNLIPGAPGIPFTFGDVRHVSASKLGPEKPASEARAEADRPGT